MECNYEEIEGYNENNGQKIKLYRPIITIQIIKRGYKLFPIDCLIDSGADTIIFPTKLADHFKISYKKGDKTTFRIAGGGSTTMYELPYEKHQIDLFVNDIRIKEKIHFSDGQTMPLLGQDFFKYFNITFKRKEKKIILDFPCE